jgi:hypothetical protein
LALVLGAGLAGVVVGMRASDAGPAPAATRELCGKPIPATVVEPLRAPMLAAAIGSDATLTIRTRAGSPACQILRNGAHLVLGVGQRVQFVATALPTLAGAGAVQVTSGPGPELSGPGGSSPHLVVTVTARRPGVVEVGWTACSGTAC